MRENQYLYLLKAGYGNLAVAGCGSFCTISGPPNLTSPTER